MTKIRQSSACPIVHTALRTAKACTALRMPAHNGGQQTYNAASMVTHAGHNLFVHTISRGVPLYDRFW